MLGEYHIPADSAAGRRRLEDALVQRRAAREENAFKMIRRGWFLGDNALKQELLAQMSERAGKSHYGPELRESAEAKAERIVAEELRRLGLREDELSRRRKGDGKKARIARRVRRETVE